MVIDQARGQDGWILTKFFFCVFMDRDGVEASKHAKNKKQKSKSKQKNRTRSISSHLDRASLVNNHYLLSEGWKKKTRARSSLQHREIKVQRKTPNCSFPAMI